MISPKINNKILFLLHLPPPVHGSSIMGLSIKDSNVINKSFDCSYINLLASQKVADSGKVSLNKISSFIATWIKIFSSLIRTRPNLCYLALTSTGAAFYKDLLIVALLKSFKIKHVFHLHNKGFSLHQHKWYIRVCYRFVFRNAEVILLSKHLYPDIQKFVPKNRIHICPNGIDGNSQKLKPSSLKPDTTVQVLFLSNLIRSKGVFVLLEALALLAQKGISFEGVVIGGEGDITESQFNEHVRQLDLNDCVSYHGKKYGEEKSNAFSKADIFVFPTYYETFGLVNLEAMQHSLPIVSTLEGGICDIVDDGVTGFLVPQKNVKLLSEKLEILIKNPVMRKQMGAAGRKKYEQEFTLEIFEKRLINILHSMIGKD